MKNEQLQDWIQIVGLFAVVASLVFVGIEIRQSSRAASDASLLSDAQSITMLEELVANNADVWLRGCRGEELEPAEEMVFTHIFHAYEFQYFLRWLRAERGVATATANITINNMAMNLHRHLGLRRAWDEHFATRTHLPDDIDLHLYRDAVEAEVEEYRDFEPEPYDNIYRCGLN